MLTYKNMSSSQRSSRNILTYLNLREMGFHISRQDDILDKIKNNIDVEELIRVWGHENIISKKVEIV